eukprot:4647364-Lingulodinium_polyedra.AAC.1
MNLALQPTSTLRCSARALASPAKHRASRRHAALNRLLASPHAPGWPPPRQHLLQRNNTSRTQAAAPLAPASQ